jgi:hypothetical protein
VKQKRLPWNAASGAVDEAGRVKIVQWRAAVDEDEHYVSAIAL